MNETTYHQPTFLQRANAEGRFGQKVTTDLLCPYTKKSCDYDPDDERCHHKGESATACKHFFGNHSKILDEQKKQRQKDEDDTFSDSVRDLQKRYKTFQQNKK